ncbi:MAG: cytochrome ubiquinol oxidase subunit I [Verrucomicrobiota bacterium]|nr:cytochrome ubiquinol oxidase subunit I [Limisphaera sp.]MDW8380534.1 cytochrome ubiquinol oxidase subunit I [Verrucomicrobiota bacterium]
MSRIQFAATVAFHYLYPPLSIGLGVMLVIFESLWLRTNNPLYHQLARYWTRIFALTFALGVASGIVMEFEFGTNWANYSRFVGDVFGSALAAEGIFAFFLESGFLAVLLFGWDKVKRSTHFFATSMVCLGAHFSAIWIVVANSWMQTPAGFHIVDTPMGPRAEITDFWSMVFNPSSMHRLSHVLCGCWQAGAFLVVSVGAWYLLKQRHHDFGRACVKYGLLVGLTASVLQIVTGHISAEGVARNQPAKLAAFEGLFETQPRAPLYLFGWVDEQERKVHGLAVPGLLSWLVHGDTDRAVTGLDQFPKEDWPPVNRSFQFYRLMVAIGFGMVALALLGSYHFWRGTLESRRWLLWLLVLSVLGPQIANQAGWFAAEIGRQPWIVYGIMRTAEGVSPNLSAHTVLASLVLFTFIYFLLFAVFLYLLNEKIQKGPDAEDLVPTGKLALPFKPTQVG